MNIVSEVLNGISNPQEFPETVSELISENDKALILHNDDYNTFDHVINCLIEICNHGVIQAEQCAYIVHFNGKCDVMHGEETVLNNCCKLLKLKGLTATVE